MMQNMYTAMGISPEVYEYGEQTLVSLKDRFDEIDKTAEYNQLKVLKAMQDCRVSEACLPQPATAITISAETRWKQFMRPCSIPRQPWCVLRSPVEHTRSRSR